LRDLISWTEVRAASASAQKPGSACLASSAFSRSAFPDKSKKVSEFSHTALEIRQTVDELGHANDSLRGYGAKVNGSEK
jgi:hypothetical protein